LAVRVLGRVTGQPAPSSSTPIGAGATAAAVAVLATNVSVPAATSAATVSMTAAERILSPPELKITGVLLPDRGGKG
jgi:hypothetical protein